MPFPLIKLVYLFIKQYSKPVANRITTELKKSTFVRTRILIPSAQWYHRVDIAIKMNLIKQGRPKHVEPLSDEVALQLSTDMLNDTFIFLIATGILFAEWRRGAINSAMEKEKLAFEFDRLEKKIVSMRMITEEQDAKLRELQRHIFDLETRNKSLGEKLMESVMGSRPTTVEAGQLKVILHPDVEKQKEEEKEK